MPSEPPPPTDGSETSVAARLDHRSTLRYIQLRIVPLGETLHPLEDILEDDVLTTRRGIHDLRQLEDGTVTGLYELELSLDHPDASWESLDALEAAYENHRDLVSYAFTRFESRVYSLVRMYPNDTVAGLLAVPRRHGLVVKFPMEYTPEGELRALVVGDMEMFQAARMDMPESVETEIEAVGQYIPEKQRVLSRLTDRQHATLRVAAEMGYYEEPRQVTYRDIAEEMGVAPETVGEHLRKAEATLVDEALPSQ